MFSSPAVPEVQRVPLHSAEFSDDPHRAYRWMREKCGTVVPVELAHGVPATLVIGYRTGLAILNDPDRFPADPRGWEATVSEECPALPLLRWRRCAPRNSGHVHTQMRHVVTAALDEVDLHAVNTVVERTALPLIDAFRWTGSADLVADYAAPLVFAVINELLGCPPEISAKAAAGIAALLDGTASHDGNRVFEGALRELMDLRRDTPGTDITTGLLRHGSTLDDEEILQQLVLFYGVGMEPVQSLIVNALRLVFIDDDFNTDIFGGTLSTRDAIDRVLFEDPTLPNNCFSYPRQPVLVDGVWLPANQPVIVSLAGCNNDPEIADGDLTGNRAHLAWSAGPHACPARSLAHVIAQCAIDELLDTLPELRLAISVDELRWRQGPAHRALLELPVAFPTEHSLPRS